MGSSRGISIRYKSDSSALMGSELVSRSEATAKQDVFCLVLCGRFMWLFEKKASIDPLDILSIQVIADLEQNQRKESAGEGRIHWQIVLTRRK